MTERGGRGRWAPRWNLMLLIGAIAVVGLASAAGLLYVDRSGEALIERQERLAVDNELDFFSEAQIDEGDEGLVRAVARRARLESQGRLYALKDASGAVVAGNVAAWPSGLGDASPWRAARVNDDMAAHIATTQLENGYVALVGREDSAQAEFRGELLAAAGIALAVIASTCLLLGAVVTGAILRRVNQLSTVSMRVSAGDFSARAARADEAGPFGDIARAQNAMLDRIEALVIGLRTVTDSLAHDLRTPLARLRQKLESGLVDDRPGAGPAALEAALIETDRTIATFSALVDVARATGGLSNAAMTDVDLAALVRDAVELFEPLAEERGMQIVCAVEPAAARASKALLMQAVSNLIHNAIKYGPEGGEIEAALHRNGEDLEIVVADRGPGIPENRRADAVERFQRLRQDDDDLEGLGLGLAIVEACARLHGGRLSLEDNAPGLRARLILRASAGP